MEEEDRLEILLKDISDVIENHKSKMPLALFAGTIIEIITGLLLRNAPTNNQAIDVIGFAVQDAIAEYRKEKHI